MTRPCISSMLRFTLGNGRQPCFDEKIIGIDDQEELELVFRGEAFLSFMSSPISVHNVGTTEERIIKAEWYDTDTETSLHGYVLERMNAEGVGAVFAWADGGYITEKPMEVISNYWMGFHEAVENQINLDGLEFVVGNGFCLSSILNLVCREIVRCYLREHQLY